MDESDKDIFINDNGICNHCLYFEAYVKEHIQETAFDEPYIGKKFEYIKSLGKNKKYDCIIGISGGVDSSYVVYLAKKHGLRCLLVHLDNGWNSEFAVDNVKNIVEYSGYDLFTYVINWEEFKDIQKSFFHSDVIDLELVSDHAIFATVFKMAIKNNVKIILSGENLATEAIMPKSWNWRKSDSKNIISIHKEYGTGVKLKTFPFMSTLKRLVYKYLYGIKSISILNYMSYNKNDAISVLEQEMNWRNYPGKHYESIFTRFYQGVILPKKFNVDKRKAHLSTLINSGQISRRNANEILSTPTYDLQLQEQDFVYISKKLDFSRDALEEYLSRPEKSHLSYGSDEWIFNILRKVRSILKSPNVKK